MQSSGEQPLVGEEHCVTTLITAAKETTKDGGRPISSRLMTFDRHQIEIRLVKYER